MEKMRIGVVGVGYMGRNHARIYSELDNVDLVGVCDSIREIGETIASQFKTKSYSDYHELIDKVDGVSIATPVESHYPIARDFLENGVHVLVEKTLTACEEEALKLIEEAKKSKLVLQVGHVERYNPAVVKLNEIVSTPRFIECHRMGPYPGRGTMTNVVMEVMIHDLDIILPLVNSSVKSVDAFGTEVLSRTSDIVNARINFSSGCSANVTASRVSEEVLRKIRVFQPKSYISVDYAEQQVEIFEKGENNHINKKQVPIEKKEPLREELTDFVGCIKQGKNPRVTGEDGLKSLRLANMICNCLKNKEL